MRHDAPLVVWKPRDRVPRLAAPALDAAAVEFGGNGAERLTGERRRIARSTLPRLIAAATSFGLPSCLPCAFLAASASRVLKARSFSASATYRCNRNGI